MTPRPATCPSAAGNTNPFVLHLLLAVTLMAFGPAEGGTLVTESFSPTIYGVEDTQLSGLGEEGDGFGGPWHIQGDTAAVLLSGDGLRYRDASGERLATTGGSIMLCPQAPSARPVAAIRQLDLHPGSPWSAYSSDGKSVDRGVLYFSFLVRVQNTSGASCRAAFSLSAGVGQEHDYLQLGFSDDRKFEIVFVGDSAVRASERVAQLPPGDVVLVVGRIDFSKNLSLKVWLNPPLGQETARTPAAELSVVAPGWGFDHLVLSSIPVLSESACDVIFDEFRFGETFTSVLPIR